MQQIQALGRSALLVPRLGLGTMTWGNPSGLSRYTPAKLAYGGADALTRRPARSTPASPRG